MRINRTEQLKKALPTFFGYWERRSLAAKNRLPKHLRPLPRWPLLIQLALNTGIIAALAVLMINKDDFVTDAGPAAVLVICLLLIIYTLISGFQLKHRYQNVQGHRLAVLNFWVMLMALLMFPLSVAFFLPQ